MAYVSKNTRQGNKLGRGAVVEYKSAPLSGEFGLKMLHAKFPEQAPLYLAKLGVYSRGPRKGQPRGYIHWRKVIEGGWDYHNRSGVLRPGCDGWAIMDGQCAELSKFVEVPLDPRPAHELSRQRRNEQEANEREDTRLLLEDAGTAPELIEAALIKLSEAWQRGRERDELRFSDEVAKYEADVAELMESN